MTWEWGPRRATIQDGKNMIVKLSARTTLGGLLQNPLTKHRDDADRTGIVASFSALENCPQEHLLVLRPYLNRRPDRFFDKRAYFTYLHWLKLRDQQMSEQLKEYLAGFDTDISRALFTLKEINVEDWHDNQLTNGDDYELNRVIDKHVHPAYLRLIEAVLVPLLRPIAHFSRIDRQKGTEGLDAWPIVQELQGLPEECLTKQYEHTVRNGIAHGGITFLQDEIRYRDQRGNENTLGKRGLEIWPESGMRRPGFILGVTKGSEG